MGIKVTRLSVEVAGASLGTVAPKSPSTIYTPFVRNNWADAVVVESAWRTTIATSESTGSEQRVQRRKRPVRTLDATITSMSQEESLDLQMTIQEMQRRSDTGFPLYCDRTEFSSNASSTDTKIFCDVRFKRFYNGQKVVLTDRHFKRRNYGVKALGLYAFISSVDQDGLTLQSPLGYAFSAGDFIFPIIDVHPNLSTTVSLLSDYYTETKLTALELDGPSCLPSTWAGAEPPPGASFESLPILEIRPNWKQKVQQKLIRKGVSYGSGIGSQVSLSADKPQMSVQFSTSDYSREEAWDLLRFFDSRQGRTKPFWLVSPLSVWAPVAVNTSYVEVPDHNYLANIQDLVGHIALTDSRGVSLIKKVDSVTTGIGTFKLNFTTNPFASAPSGIVSIAPAWRSRFDSDSLRQAWATDTVSSSPINVVEILNEKEAGVSNL